jgi:hypothetical protein
MGSYVPMRMARAFFQPVGGRGLPAQHAGQREELRAQIAEPR